MNQIRRAFIRDIQGQLPEGIPIECDHTGELTGLPRLVALLSGLHLVHCHVSFDAARFLRWMQREVNARSGAGYPFQRYSTSREDAVVVGDYWRRTGLIDWFFRDLCERAGYAHLPNELHTSARTHRVGDTRRLPSTVPEDFFIVKLYALPCAFDATREERAELEAAIPPDLLGLLFSDLIGMFFDRFVTYKPDMGTPEGRRYLELISDNLYTSHDHDSRHNNRRDSKRTSKPQPKDRGV